jgi:hypothetical protein
VRKKYSGYGLREAMELLQVESFTRWSIDAEPLPPTEHLLEDMRRFEAFDLEGSEAAKLLLLDTLFAEIVPNYPNLKVWKAAPLESDILVGVADYLIAPRRGYLATPLLCVAEAKKDDFLQGRAQCLVEIAACLWNNRRDGIETDVYGIVSNGQVWQFYRRALSGEIGESELYNTSYLSSLLGALNHVCAECARNATAPR